LKRQLRIARPDASEEELSAAAEGGAGLLAGARRRFHPVCGPF
jgi:t-SNARE complex subunit (syntaxin)